MAFPATFQDIQNAVIAKARLSSTNDLSAVKDWINQVYTETCIENEANVGTVTATLTANTSSYDLSTLASTVRRIKSMYVTRVGGVQSRPLRLVTLDQILTWRQAGGGTAVANGTVEYYALVGLNQIEFYPTPGSADTLTIWAVKAPTALSANGDTPILPEPYASKVLEYGALAEAADFKGDPAQAQYVQMYELWKSKLRTHLTRRAGTQPRQFGFIPSGIYPPHDPSTDLR